MADPLCSPGVKFPPPFIVAGLALIAWQLGRARPWPLFASGRTPLTSGVGWAILLLGLLFVMWGFMTFRRAGTAIAPISPASVIVQTGPYRFSRNPMYVGMTTMLLGGSVLTNNLWTLTLVPVALGLLYLLVIRREEAYLMSAFPNDYAAFCARVGRFF